MPPGSIRSRSTSRSGSEKHGPRAPPTPPTSSPRGSLPPKRPANSEQARRFGPTPAATSTISSTASTNVITYQSPLDRTYLRERPLGAQLDAHEHGIDAERPRTAAGVEIEAPDCGLVVLADGRVGVVPAT